MKRIKLGKDVGISRTNHGFCSLCGEKMRWGVSVGSVSNYNRSNAWLHYDCLVNLPELIKQGKIKTRWNKNDTKDNLIILKQTKKGHNGNYCSWCGIHSFADMIYLRKKPYKYVVYFHLNCLDNMIAKLKEIIPNSEEIDKKIMVEDL